MILRLWMSPKEKKRASWAVNKKRREMGAGEISFKSPAVFPEVPSPGTHLVARNPL